ncbi:hypothetical protein DFH09DRAFT_1081813 [Mycena vulgaris]|nr:hypothetical protein DFH09DRAFT_1081813 [Mycena vulgaris]
MLLFRLRGLHLLGFQQDNISQIWSLLPAFSSLRTLHLYGEQLTPWTDSFIPDHLPFFESFRLSMAHFVSYDILTPLLSQFPSLKTLKLVRFPFLQLQLNMLSFALYPGILGWLKSIDFSLSAPCLEMDIPQEDTDLGDYLKIHGKNLRHLTLKFPAKSQLWQNSLLSVQPPTQSDVAPTIPSSAKNRSVTLNNASNSDLDQKLVCINLPPHIDSGSMHIREACRIPMLSYLCTSYKGVWIDSESEWCTYRKIFNSVSI